MNYKKECMEQARLLGKSGERELSLLAKLESAEKKIKILEKGVLAVNELINNSKGVAGLHLNGDVADWKELLEGGSYESWLREYSDALAVAMCDKATG